MDNGCKLFLPAAQATSKTCRRLLPPARCIAKENENSLIALMLCMITNITQGEMLHGNISVGKEHSLVIANNLTTSV